MGGRWRGQSGVGDRQRNGSHRRFGVGLNADGGARTTPLPDAQRADQSSRCQGAIEKISPI